MNQLLRLLFLVFPFMSSFAGVSIVGIDEVIREWNTIQVIDARELTSYKKGHLPGAIHMDWREYRNKSLSLKEIVFGIRSGLVLDEPGVISKRLSILRIREDLPILVYGGGGPWGEEGRVAWNLLFWGAKDVRLLDGGWKSWKENKTTLKPVTHPSKIFKVKLDGRRRIKYKELKSALQRNWKIYDVRSAEEFRGKKAHGVKGGRISSANLFNDSWLYDSNGHYPKAQRLLELIPSLKEAKITYCTGGVRSALAALLIEARFGIAVSNYDGSMWEWQTRINN
jgi:thiosulfate/3-mercaptopyruvate sulfurtransferase